MTSHSVVRFSLIFFGVIALSLSLDSCKSGELEGIVPFEFKVDYPDPPEDIKLEKPAVSEPQLPTVQQSAEATQQTQAIAAAATPAALPPSVQASLAASISVGTATGLSSAAVQSFDKGDLNALASTPVANLDPNVVSAAVAAGQNPVLRALFPTIKLPGTGGRIADDAQVFPVINPIEPEAVSGTLEEVAPCAEKLKEDFDAQIAILNEWRDTNQKAINDFFTPALYSEVDTRFEARKQLLQNNYNNFIELVKQNTILMLDAADRFQNDFPVEAQQIRQFALIWYYYHLIFFDDYYKRSLAELQKARDDEKNDLDTAKQLALQGLTTGYDREYSIYKLAYDEAYDKCHNQGSGG